MATQAQQVILFEVCTGTIWIERRQVGRGQSSRPPQIGVAWGTTAKSFSGPTLLDALEEDLGVTQQDPQSTMSVIEFEEFDTESV